MRSCRAFYFYHNEGYEVVWLIISASYKAYNQDLISGLDLTLLLATYCSKPSMRRALQLQKWDSKTQNYEKQKRIRNKWNCLETSWNKSRKFKGYVTLHPNPS